MNDEKRLSVSGESLYAILDLPKDCTPEEIKKSYRKKALRLHPDKNPNNPEAEEGFKKLNYANRILSDERKRKVYDYHGSMGIQAVEMMGDGVIPAFLLVSSKWFQAVFWFTFCCTGCCFCCCCFNCCNSCCRGCGGRCKFCADKEEEDAAFPQPEDAEGTADGGGGVTTNQPKSEGNGPFVIPPEANEATALNPTDSRTSYSKENGPNP
eukprot:TRINITY_DN3983_c0_g1_i1.p1 TRINITY_DN3983_c0_g1~~TRINITY_DN3983_c0_g1_i1.p1  ORF type:complete len:210 (+),score=78.84 TRINITY_DN3983_c0_g1_i1:166-795(+)